MTDIKYLEDFPFKTQKFLKKLKNNNNREWFKSHKNEYEELFLKPAQAFVEQIGLHLFDINPEFNAIPKIDKSIFRLHRDVRFSKNKDPYKTNLGVLFWEGPGKKMESSGLYFHIDTKNYFIATGMYQFTKDQIKKYREFISIEDNGKELDKIVKQIEKKGYSLGGKTFKKVPRGYDKEYKYANLLLHSGVYVYKESNINDLKNNDIIKFTIKTYNEIKSLQDWLVKNLT